MCCDVVTVRGATRTGGDIVIGGDDVTVAAVGVAVVATTDTAISPSDVCCELVPLTGSSEIGTNAAAFCVAAANAA